MQLRTWTAFTRDALVGATFDGLTLAPNHNLVVAGQGSLETQTLERPFQSCVISWNALTPPTSTLFLEARVRFGQAWSGFLRVAQWGNDPLQNTTFADSDENVFLETDTLICKTPADALQLRVTLGGAASLTGLAVAFLDDEALELQTSSQTAWGVDLPVPTRSQMIYPDGGRVWCSPTSTTMLLEYWSAKFGRSLADTVPETAKAVWDVMYRGAGNWAFNMAYASSKGLQAYVTSLSSFAEAETWIARGVPLALSIGWKDGELEGAPIGHSAGHLVVLCGFTQDGDPIVNDPAQPTDDKVRMIYPRDQLERAWLAHSGGVVYVVQPTWD